MSGHREGLKAIAEAVNAYCASERTPFEYVDAVGWMSVGTASMLTEAVERIDAAAPADNPNLTDLRNAEWHLTKAAEAFKRIHDAPRK